MVRKSKLGPCVDLDLPESLHGVGVNERATFLRPGGEHGQGLNRADLVVDPHHRANRNIVVNERIERSRVNHAIGGGHRQHPALGALEDGLMNGAQRRPVLDG